MSKLIQSAYNCIESNKFKKAVSILDSPELARYPLAKAFASSLRFIRSLYRRIAAYRWGIQQG